MPASELTDMTGWTTSAVLIAPIVLRGEANALAEAMGWGPDCYSVALSSDGHGPPTHHGLRTWASKSFAPTVEAARRGELPDDLAGSFDPQAVAALVAALTISIRPGVADPAAHFEDVITSARLNPVKEDET